MTEDPRYPIGKYIAQPFSEKQLGEWLIDIKYLPQHLENAILNLDEAQLNTPYRDGGWTVKQLVHHVADSHMNAYIRFKLGLTEESPVTIRPYDENAWAEMNDTKNLPVNLSLTILHALHARWYEILRHLTEADFQRTVYHPANKKEMTLWFVLGMYAWHSRHHTAHVTSLRERMEW
ncbi:MAG: bacillithiol transferase BstA [Ferruginibacter sp.]|nr:bacillithiol transferase BstA [Ferruginibacter sp.]